MAAQKPPQQHLTRETSLLGTTRSPTAVARAPTTSREMVTSAVNFGEISETGLGSVSAKVSPCWGNGRSRAQWRRSKQTRTLDIGPS